MSIFEQSLYFREKHAFFAHFSLQIVTHALFFPLFLHKKIPVYTGHFEKDRFNWFRLFPHKKAGGFPFPKGKLSALSRQFSFSGQQ